MQRCMNHAQGGKKNLIINIVILHTSVTQISHQIVHNLEENKSNRMVGAVKAASLADEKLMYDFASIKIAAASRSYQAKKVTFHGPDTTKLQSVDAQLEQEQTETTKRKR